MSNLEWARPDAGEIALLLADVARLYVSGGPAAEDGRPSEEDRVSVELWHGEVLAELTNFANDDAETFAVVARAHHLDTAAGVRDLIRLSTASAVTSALRYVLGHADPVTGERVSARAVESEILAEQWWVRQDAASNTKGC